MGESWAKINDTYKKLKLWAMSTLKRRADYDNPEDVPFFVSHAEFLKINAEGMLELVPFLEKDDEFSQLDVSIDNFILTINFEKSPYQIQIWSEEKDLFTLTIRHSVEQSLDAREIVPPEEVVDVLLEFLTQVGTQS